MKFSKRKIKIACYDIRLDMSYWNMFHIIINLTIGILSKILVIVIKNNILH